jgi:hypothetical protein
MKLPFLARLTGFEEYFFWKDTVDNPSTFCVEMELAGTLNRDTTEAAVRYVCQHHPLLTCLVDMNKGRPQWRQTDSAPGVEWLAQPLSISNLPGSHIDITSEFPLKIFGYVGSQTENERPPKLVFLLHHTAVDGLGTLHWLNDFMRVYRCLELGDAPPNLNRRAELLSLRCRPRLGWLQALWLLPGQWLSVRETFRILSRKTIPLVPWSTPANTEVRPPRCLDFRLSADETKVLKKKAARIGTSLNNWALRSLLVAIEQWQRKRVDIEPTGRQADGTHFRIVVPVNERGRSLRSLPACNHCTMINIDFPREVVSQDSGLLPRIERIFSRVARWKLSLNCWRGMEVFRWLPGGLKKLARNESVAATALLTNVGRVLQDFSTLSVDHSCERLGDEKAMALPPDRQSLCVADLKAYPPLQRGMVFAIVLYYFNHELRISAQYDQRFLTPTHAEQLLTAFRQELLLLATGLRYSDEND